MRRIDLTNKRFGRLLVIAEHPEPYRSPSGKPYRRWICRCDCGNETVVLQNQLATGKTVSCGCLQKEKASLKHHDLTGRRFGKLLVLSRVPLEKEYANGTRYGWLCRCDCGNEKVILARCLTSGESTSCGCVTTEKAAKRMEDDNVLGRYKGTVVSAIKRDRVPNKNNTSGIKGVYWSNSEQKWIAKIGFQGRSITIGRYKEKEDAAKARKEAEAKLFDPIIEEWEQITNAPVDQ